MPMMKIVATLLHLVLLLPDIFLNVRCCVPCWNCFILISLSLWMQRMGIKQSQRGFSARGTGSPGCGCSRGTAWSGQCHGHWACPGWHCLAVLWGRSPWAGLWAASSAWQNHWDCWLLPSARTTESAGIPSAPTHLPAADFCVCLLPCSWEYKVLVLLWEYILLRGHIFFSPLLSWDPFHSSLGISSFVLFCLVFFIFKFCDISLSLFAQHIEYIWRWRGSRHIKNFFGFSSLYLLKLLLVFADHSMANLKTFCWTESSLLLNIWLQRGVFVLPEEVRNLHGQFNHDLVILFKIYSSNNCGFIFAFLICRGKYLLLLDKGAVFLGKHCWVLCPSSQSKTIAQVCFIFPIAVVK